MLLQPEICSQCPSKKSELSGNAAGIPEKSTQTSSQEGRNCFGIIEEGPLKDHLLAFLLKFKSQRKSI